MPANDKDTEPRNPQPREFMEPPASDERALRPRKGRQRQALGRLSRQLSEQELSGAGALKMLLDLLDTLEDENEELREFRDEFHMRDKEVAVLRERLREATAREIVLGATMIGGSAILGYAPALWQSQPTGLFAVVVGALLVLGSVAGRLTWKPQPAGSAEKRR